MFVSRRMGEAFEGGGMGKFNTRGWGRGCKQRGRRTINNAHITCLLGELIDPVDDELFSPSVSLSADEMSRECL